MYKKIIAEELDTGLQIMFIQRSGGMEIQFRNKQKTSAGFLHVATIQSDGKILMFSASLWKVGLGNSQYFKEVEHYLYERANFKHHDVSRETGSEIG